MTARHDLVDVLVDDHCRIGELLSTAAEGNDAAADRHLSAGLAELSRHIVVEEEYLYPLIRETGPDGAELAEEARLQSQDAERVIRELEHGAAERDLLIDDLIERVRTHVELADAHVFPALRRSYQPFELEHLAGVVEMAKRTAPSRAHPGAPSTPPWNQILAPGIGLIDKVRDALSGRTTKPDRL